MLRSILIALDGSACSSAAVELGIRWARRFDALLVGIGIVDEPAIRERGPVLVGAGKVEQDRWLLTDARRRVEGFLERFVRRCAIEGVKYGVVKDVGTPETQIVQKSRLCDLVMLSQRPDFRFEVTGWPDQTLSEVLRRSSRPVVAVPESHREGEGILVAYDGSPQADRAMQAVQALGLPDEDVVHVLSVQADQGSAERLAGPAVEFLRLHGVKATPLPIPARMSVHRIIITQAQKIQPRLLVMGVHGQPMWREFIFGSITTRIVEASPVPLFLCR